ncbi:unnamed protein product [Calicophoron daubneyi]|uniref:CBS domain-containing protein n=1 Tax=Calicophoron daubneyi TaxID=300641 RepID=A0AAV2SYL5_CALDB
MVFNITGLDFLQVIRAIRALLENGIQAAPIWHSALQKVVGLFSRDIALHLLASLCPEKQSPAEPVQQVPTNGVGSSVDCSPEKSSNLASGLAKWGKKQLLDVLRLFYQEPDEHPFELTESALIVSPQTVLRKVFCLFTHHHKHRGSAADRHHHSPQSCKQSDVNIHHLLEEHYDCCFELDPPEIESKDALTTDPSKSQYRHSSEPVVAAHCAADTQSSKNQQAFSANGDSSYGPSAACSIPSLSNPSHVIVVDPNSGNALGLLNTNRLLVYLRMRSEELPCSPQIISPVGCIPGLRWAERCTLNARNRTRSGSGSSLSTTSDLFQASDPVLLSTTTCSEAISRLIEWLPYLPCLPVVYMNEGAATQPTALLGFVSPGDILTDIATVLRVAVNARASDHVRNTRSDRHATLVASPQ